MKRLLIPILCLGLLCGGVQSCKDSGQKPPVAVNHEDFDVAKAMIDLSYITHDKMRVARFRDNYTAGIRSDQALQTWADKFTKPVVLVAIDRYLKLSLHSATWNKN